MINFEFNSREIGRMLDYSFDRAGLDSKDLEATLRKKVAKVEKAIQDAVVKVLEEETNKILDLVKNEIDSQPALWQELNEGYKKWKESSDLNPDMLKATEQYYDSIGILEAKTDNKGGVTIRGGVPPKPHINKDGEEEEITLPELAAIHEFGTERTPPRPHWYPGFRKWEYRYKNVEKSMLKEVEKVLIKELGDIFEIDEQSKRTL